MSPWGRAWRALAPVPAIVVGAAVSSAPPAALGPSLLAWIVGATAFLLATRASRVWPLRAIPWAATALVALTLVSPGIEGVHRWLSLGPARLNASAAFLPLILLSVADIAGAARGRALVLVCAVQVIHLAQPDAAQATALACAAPLLVVGAGRGRKAELACLVLLVALAVITWTRRDPLPPIDHVERVLRIAASRGLLWLAACVAAALALLGPALAARASSAPGAARLGGAVALYLAASTAATFAGNFPVPVLGAGAGPILGWFAFTVGLARSQEARPPLR